MKILKTLLSVCIVLTFTGLNMYCGSDPGKEAETALQSGNYNLAIKLLLDARAKNPQDQSIPEKIALAYMYRGQELYQKSNNIKSFSGNYDKALNYIPDTPSEEFKKTYSKLLLSLAEGYMSAKPQNDIEKEDFLNNAIARMDDAIYNDQFNTRAESLLTVIKTENFQKMVDKGKDLYSQAEKQKNYDLYFSSEYYFKKASEFDIYNQEVKKLLSQVRKKTLDVPNIKDDLALAVVEYKRFDGDLVIDVTVRNHLANPIMINLDNFLLTDTEGNTYTLNKSSMDSKFAANKFKGGNLGPGDRSGLLVFKVPSDTKFEYLGYKMDSGQVSKKYFP